MPNIIEQQDLLKGLPDARLAMLMQKPDASIPPFLVAAEAQRRQSIRQQFGGDGSKESVVDTLTKQLANVPQNIQAPMQTPPNIPAPAGIAALQQPQQMAHGGPVRRFANGTLVTPSVGSRVQEVADQFGVSVDEAAEMIKNNPSLSGYGFTAPGLPFKVAEENREPMATPSIPAIPVLTKSPAEMAALERENRRNAKYEEMDSYGGYAGKVEPPTPENVDVSNYAITTPDIPIKKPRKENSSTEGTSAENKEKAEDSAYRKRIEELFASREPSNWEEAQKWFAMSAELLDPGQTLMQGIAGAGQIYAQAESEQAQAKRLDERELQKALLQYDISERDYGRQVAAQAQTNKLEALKYQAGAAYKEAELYRKAADDASDALNRQIAALTSSSGIGGIGMTQADIAKDPTVMALQKRVNDANEKLRNATIRAQGFNTYFGNAYGLPAGFEASDGESFFNIGE